MGSSSSPGAFHCTQRPLGQSGGTPAWPTLATHLHSQTLGVAANPYLGEASSVTEVRELLNWRLSQRHTSRSIIWKGGEAEGLPRRDSRALAGCAGEMSFPEGAERGPPVCQDSPPARAPQERQTESPPGWSPRRGSSLLCSPTAAGPPCRPYVPGQSVGRRQRVAVGYLPDSY